MRLTDIVSFLDQSLLTQIAMLLFLGVFIAVVINVLRKSRKQVDKEASIPLEDDVVMTPRDTHTREDEER